MAHINHTRQLRTRLFGTLEEIMPLSMGGCSFAAFGGTPDQRADAAVQALARYCGRCGIVVLLNGSDREGTGRLEAMLHRLPRYLDRPAAVRSLAWSDYDLLYGLDAADVCELMFPAETSQGYAAETNMARQGLQAYLEIIRCQFRADPSPFGRYPFNLDLLHQLTRMSYPRLERTVLRYLPPDVRDYVQGTLSRDYVQQQVFSVVNRFAERFQRFGIRPGDFGGHSRRSICQAVSDREIICLRIPGSSGVLLNYVEAELAQLSEAGTPFLLLSAELDLNGSPALRDRFLRTPPANCYMGILSESLSAVAPTEEQQKRIFSSYPQILVFQCAAAELAEPFSRNCGGYKRREVHQTRTTQWRPFHLLPTTGTGREVVETDERNIRPEELTSLGTGVLLMGKYYDPPERICNLRQNRGSLNGLFLQALPPGN